MHTQETVAYTGRTKRPWYKKINPIWWLGNDEEPTPPDWYKQQEPTLTTLKWYLRNPLQNFGRYVAGYYDQNYTVTGDAPVNVTTWWEYDGSTGWKRHRLNIGLGRPFWSYESNRIIFYFGWQAHGFFGAKFNLKSSFQLW